MDIAFIGGNKNTSETSESSVHTKLIKLNKHCFWRLNGVLNNNLSKCN